MSRFYYEELAGFLEGIPERTAAILEPAECASLQEAVASLLGRIETQLSELEVEDDE